MIRIASAAGALLLLFQCSAMADWTRDAFCKSVRSEAIKLSNSPRTDGGVDRVRKAVNEQLDKYRIQGTVKVLVDPIRGQVGIRVDSARFVLVVVANMALTYNELVQ